MRERDKKWRRSAKLQAAFVAGVVAISILAGNFHNETICVEVLHICEVVISSVVVSRTALQGVQSFADRWRPPYRPPSDFVPSNIPQEESK